MNNIISFDGFEMVTFDNHGFDEETVKFLFIDYCPSSMDTELPQWGLKAMKITQHDYTARGSPQTARWVIMEEGEALMLFKLKYKNKIIIETTQKEMNKLMRIARSFVKNRLYRGTSTRVDYMDALAMSTEVTRAIGKHIRTNPDFR